jgi:hypothetical protein
MQVVVPAKSSGQGCKHDFDCRQLHGGGTSLGDKYGHDCLIPLNRVLQFIWVKVTKVTGYY